MLTEKAKKVIIYPSGNEVSAKYRVIYPYTEASYPGFQFKVAEQGKLYMDEALEYDAIMLHMQSGGAELVDFIKHLQSRGKKVVFDMDDDIFAIPSYNGRTMATRELHDIRMMVHSCDALHCSTPEIRNKIEHPNTAVFLNAIPNCDYPPHSFNGEMRRKLAIPDGVPVVIWTGAKQHRDDLLLIREAIFQLIAQGVWVVLVGDKDWLNAMGFKRKFGLIMPGVLPFGDYLKIFACADLCLAPLVDNPFNACKSELKLIQAAACGVPCLCSDVAPHRRFLEITEAGFNVGKGKTRHWVKKALRALEEPEMLRHLGYRARSSVFMDIYSNARGAQARLQWWSKFLN